MNRVYQPSDLLDDMLRKYDEGTARGPMTDELVTWEWLVEQEPELNRLEGRCRELANPGKAYDNWYGGTCGGRIKYEMCCLVGSTRRDPVGHPNLYGSMAYDVAYDHLLGILEGRL